MKILTNAYKKLKQENIDESVKLDRKNRKDIEEMMDYISSHNISLFEIEILKKDLIGMAKEAEEEKSLLKDKLGDKKIFCDSLIDGTMKKKTLNFC